jgi:hypothetical protein
LQELVPHVNADERGCIIDALADLVNLSPDGVLNLLTDRCVQTAVYFR